MKPIFSVIVSGVLTVALVIPVSAAQESKSVSNGRNATPAVVAVSSDPSGSPVASSSATPITKGKSAEAKLKSCQAREKAINKRSANMISLTTRMVAKFTDISNKVDSYYLTSLVPQGKIVSNYAALNADIATKKTILDTGVATATATLAGFNCASSDPKTALTSFRINMQAVNKDLKAYRKSIKTFTRALHKVSGDSEVTPSPTATN